ncbi:MAG: cation-transporting P-type ATPase, partial [Kiloniellales bacterium]|nr:cation-transporting P-type ATPase [Kiloniellales bacterium]
MANRNEALSFTETKPKTVAFAWHALELHELVQKLNSSVSGLTQDEALERLKIFGPNELPRAKPPTLALIFIRQFKNPLVFLLVAATVISFLVGETIDAIFILSVLLINSAIGTLQEWQAQKRADELSNLVPHSARVLRGGEWTALDSGQLVQGDLVRIESGEQVSADLRLVESHDLMIDESLLTGESIPVEKRSDLVLREVSSPADCLNMAFAGTTVISGRAKALVVDTGGRTELGQIAQTLKEGDFAAPPLIRQLERFSEVIGVATVVIIGLVAFAQAIQGTPLVTVLLVAIALAVAAIPEGLPVAITVALAIATSRMLRRQVIVRSLPAVEGLGACTLIASDKTGTLTCNELTLKCLTLFDRGEPGAHLTLTGEGYVPKGKVLADSAPPSHECMTQVRALAATAALCNEATFCFDGEGAKKTGDTVDVAFLVFASKVGLDLTELRGHLAMEKSIPYEPERRYGAILVKETGSQQGAFYAHVKGAAETVVPMCRGIDGDLVMKKAEDLAAEGYRVLAVASGPVQEELLSAPEEALRGLELLGLVGLIDPIRPEVPGAIESCRSAGVSVRMVTGDHPLTALAIARQLGLAEDLSDVASGEDLKTLSPHPEALSRVIASKRVFARVTPSQKLDIVQTFQKLGHVVAVTGDGVNDAPALKAADLGVSMGQSGTDVARGAADLIIADDNFASIVAGIEEGRVAYDNIRKLIYLLISTGFGEIVLFVLALLFALPIPLFAVQLLWLNLVTNGVQHIALAFEKGEPGIEKKPPRSPDERLFDNRMIIQVLVAGGYMGTVSCIAYGWFLDRGLSLEQAR